ncbi:MAG: sporulation protein YqfD [Oscillospiraceae bacterium]|nr:sporulation protein YqfD [Oscillospiraceae bacterium]
MSSASEKIRGSVPVEILCPHPERLINDCTKRGIVFRSVARRSPISFGATVSARGARLLRAMSRDGSFTMTSSRGKGIPAHLRVARGRLAVLIMLAAVFLALRAATLFVWEIEVSGNERVPARVILGALRGHGFDYGTFGPSVASEALAESLILEIPQIQWFAVNIRGSHADVLVRERTDWPEIADTGAPADVCASKGGLIVKMSVLEGGPVRRVGDTVAQGDIIVTGGVRSRSASADAAGWARTWYELAAKYPNMSKKVYSGEEKYRRYIIIAEKKINLSPNSGIPWRNYDKIITEKVLGLPTGNILPVTLVTERYCEYTLAPQSADTGGAAREVLRQALMERLEGLAGGGEIRAAKFEASQAGGVYAASLRAECLEQIGARRAVSVKLRP